VRGRNRRYFVGVFLNRLDLQLDTCARENMRKMELLSEIRESVAMMRFGNRGILLLRERRIPTGYAGSA
jgi:hypothetical protein